MGPTGQSFVQTALIISRLIEGRLGLDQQQYPELQVGAHCMMVYDVHPHETASCAAESALNAVCRKQVKVSKLLLAVTRNAVLG